ncbi:MJ0042-type zinc finger domain-containing protein [Bradyrhizobium sp.]|uniref:MJ0042-type zinc finger domain-containing protein n=1 Tax=Bradyrhizobium sp. TaxID=376 RepID=UPI001DE13521|nr:MJ0042-type zinc finger domain-containing protein [Bradyrhizobium sp.]MBI5321682.1 zinc-ribbon domain-containing protein [Bradyrhizobium sp.]
MHIVCPNCTTSFSVNPAALGPAGRTVRCSRCKLTWLARAEDALETVAPAMAAAPAAAQRDVAAEWEAMAQEDGPPPVVDSPSVAPDWPSQAAQHEAEADWTTAARHDLHDDEEDQPKRSRLRQLFALPPFPPIPMLRGAGLIATCGAMAALVVAMIVWRSDVVRLLPQTAAFYRLVGLEVNLRGLAFKDIKITYETVDAKPVLVIEGMIVGETKKPVELPRLRFSVRDAQGAEIYAWNAVLEQTVLKPGDRAWFKSRLASPPPEGRNIDIRFFNKRDLAAGRA